MRAAPSAFAATSETATLALHGRRALHDLHLDAERIGLTWNFRLSSVAAFDLATEVHRDLAGLAGERL